MSELKKVKATQDDSGHWYVIPEELYDQFEKDNQNESMADSGEFDGSRLLRYGDPDMEHTITKEDLEKVREMCRPKNITGHAVIVSTVEDIENSILFANTKKEAFANLITYCKVIYNPDTIK